MKKITVTKENLGVLVVHCLNPLLSYYDEASKREHNDTLERIFGVIPFKDGVDKGLEEQDFNRDDVVEAYREGELLKIKNFTFQVSEDESKSFYAYGVKQGEGAVSTDSDKSAIKDLLDQTFVYDETEALLEKLRKAEETIDKLDDEDKKKELRYELLKAKRELLEPEEIQPKPKSNDTEVEKEAQEAIDDIKGLLE